MRKQPTFPVLRKLSSHLSMDFWIAHSVLVALAWFVNTIVVLDDRKAIWKTLTCKHNPQYN